MERDSYTFFKLNNMKLNTFILLQLMLITAISSCSKKTESPIALDTVSKVVVNFEGTLYVYQDTFQFSSVAGPEAAILKMNTKVNNGVWEVSHPNCKKCGDNVEVVLVSPYLKEIELISNGKVIAERSIYQKDISIINNGSGTIEYRDLKVDSINTSIKGPGGIKIVGEGAGVINVQLTGSGDYSIDQFPGNKVIAKITGKGNIYTAVKDTLDATISGSGNIFYKGFPTKIEDLTGSGKVLDNN